MPGRELCEVMALGLFALVGCGQPGATRISVSTCPDLVWSPARDLASINDGSLHVISAAAHGNRVIVGANKINSSTSDIAFSLFLYDSDRGLMPSPRGDFAFIAPRVAFDGDGTLHLLWGEASARAAWQTPDGAPVQRIYTSRLDGSTWTEPQLVYQTSSLLYWNADFAELVTVDDVVHAAIPEFGVNVINIALKGNDVTVSKTAVDVTGYTTIARTRSGVVVIGFVGRDTVQPPVANSVFAVREGAMNQARPVRVARASEGAATKTASRAQGDTVLLVWQQNDEGGLWPTELQYAMTADAGTNWTAAKEVPLSRGRPLTLTLATHPAGCTRLFSIVASGATTEFRQWVWNGEWKPTDAPAITAGRRADVVIGSNAVHVVAYVHAADGAGGRLAQVTGAVPSTTLR